MNGAEKHLRELREKLVLLKFRLDEDVPNHGFDSALAMSMEAGGVEKAIEMVDEQLKQIKNGSRRKFRMEEPKLKTKRVRGNNLVEIVKIEIWLRHHSPTGETVYVDVFFDRNVPNVSREMLVDLRDGRSVLLQLQRADATDHEPNPPDEGTPTHHLRTYWNLGIAGFGPDDLIGCTGHFQ